MQYSANNNSYPPSKPISPNRQRPFSPVFAAHVPKNQKRYDEREKRKRLRVYIVIQGVGSGMSFSDGKDEDEDEGKEGSWIGGREIRLEISEGGWWGFFSEREEEEVVCVVVCLESGGDREGGCRRGFLLFPLLFFCSLPPFTLHHSSQRPCRP